MAKAVTRYSRIRRIDWSSCLLVLVAAVAFAFQSFIVQTHLHGSAAWFDSGPRLSLSPASPHQPSPADSNPLDCPYCQAVAHTGAFFLPDTPALVLPLAWGFHAVFQVRRAAVALSPLLSWHSRAPPRA